MAEEEVNPQSQDVTEVQSDIPQATLESEELEQKDQEQENVEEKETSPEVVEDSEIIKEEEEGMIIEENSKEGNEESNKEQDVKDSEETLEQTRDIPTVIIDVCEEEPPTEENLEKLQDHEKDQVCWNLSIHYFIQLSIIKQNLSSLSLLCLGSSIILMQQIHTF